MFFGGMIPQHSGKIFYGETYTDHRKTVIGLGICMMMASILLSFGRSSTSSAAIAFFFLYMLIFGGTINVVPWVYVSLS